MKLARVPPETVRSSASKLVDDSESVKERVAVSPAFRESTPELMEMVGAVQSLVVVSVACVAALPAKSLTSAVMVRVPSLSVERSRLESE